MFDFLFNIVFRLYKKYFLEMLQDKVDKLNNSYGENFSFFFEGGIFILKRKEEILVKEKRFEKFKEGLKLLDSFYRSLKDKSEEKTKVKIQEAIKVKENKEKLSDKEFYEIPYFVSKYKTPYKISKTGKIITTDKSGKICKVNITEDGNRNRVHLRAENKNKDMRVSRLMVFMFLRDKIDTELTLPNLNLSNYKITYKDGNTLNDSLENLGVVKLEEVKVETQKSAQEVLHDDIDEGIIKSIDLLKIHGLIGENEIAPAKKLIEIIQQKGKIETYSLIREYYALTENMIYRIPESKWQFIGNLLNKLEKRNIIKVENELISMPVSTSSIKFSEQDKNLFLINTRTPVKSKIQKETEIQANYLEFLKNVKKIKENEEFTPLVRGNKFGVPYFRSNYDRIIRFLKNGNYKIVSDNTDDSRSFCTSKENYDFYKKHPHLSKKISRLENEEFREIPGFFNNERPYLISNMGRVIGHDEKGDEFLLSETSIAGGKYIGILLNDEEGKHQVSLSKLLAYVFLKETQLDKELISEFKLLDKNSRFSVKHKDGDPLNNSLDNLQIIDSYTKFHEEKEMEKKKFLESVSHEDEEVFFIRRFSKKTGFYCEGKALYNPQDNSMTLLKGSIVNSKENETYRAIYGEDARYNDVDESGVATANIRFENPSIAGAFVTGNNSNGLLEWKNKEDISLHEFYSLKRRTD
jgi:hypothetical protein